MAIAPAVPGIEVTIEVDNVALPEYEYEYEDKDVVADSHDASSNTVTKYLEVPSAAEFSVRWLLKELFNPTIHTHAEIMLDGWYLEAPWREAGDKDGARGYKYAKATSMTMGQGYVQNFRFSELEVDDSPCSQSGDLRKALSDIGCIIVHLYHAIGEEEVHTADVPQLQLSQLEPINEKIAQKCVPILGDVRTHQASLAAPRAQAGAMTYRPKLADESFASYTFHYRSTRALQSLGVIPCTRSPSRSLTLTPKFEPTMRDPSTMTREELLAELARLDAKTKKHDETVVRIKREREETATEDAADDDDEPIWTGTRPAKRREFVVLDD